MAFVAVQIATFCYWWVISCTENCHLIRHYSCERDWDKTVFCSILPTSTPRELGQTFRFCVTKPGKLSKRMRISQICQAAKSFRCRARDKRKKPKIRQSYTSQAKKSQKNVKFVILVCLKRKIAKNMTFVDLATLKRKVITLRKMVKFGTDAKNRKICCRV